MVDRPESNPPDYRANELGGIPNLVPRPDPTILTTEQLRREIAALRDWIDGQFQVRDERFRGIDKATELLNETVTRVPTETQKEVAHLRELTETAAMALVQRFEAQVTHTQSALSAALSAQRELVKAQDDANQKAIDKAEKATSEAISKNAAVSQTAREALAVQLADLKDRVTAIEQARIGAYGQRVESRQSNAALYATVGFVLSLIIAGIAIVGVIAGTR